VEVLIVKHPGVEVLVVKHPGVTAPMQSHPRLAGSGVAICAGRTIALRSADAVHRRNRSTFASRIAAFDITTSTGDINVLRIASNRHATGNFDAIRAASNTLSLPAISMHFAALTSLGTIAIR